MADPSLFDAVRIPAQVLVALDNRPLHFILQRFHYLIRLAHIVAMGAFFGAIALLDLRLLGWRAAVPLRAFAEHVLPWLYATFGVAAATGLALFLYDPVHVGSHAYFAPKLILIALALGNALAFHRTSYLAALAAERVLPTSARIAGAASLVLWTAVVVCSSLNVEPMPKVILR
ncbi:MAG: hypothetical protein NVSMB18_24690 [Acetobacteraceae bacterium]